MKKPIFYVYVFLVYGLLYAQSAGSVQSLDLYNQARSAQNHRDWYKATELYQEALRLNPSYGEAWFSLAQCAYELEQYELSVSYINNAEKYIKNRTALPNLKGFAFIGLGKLDEARAIFLKVLSTFPNDIEARFGLAQLDIFNGKFSGAEAYYLDALKRESQNKKALLSLALLADQMGKHDKAQSYGEQAIASHSGNPEVHYFAAYLAAKENNISEAERYARTAIRLDGDYDKAQKLLADILYADARYTETIEICDFRIAKNRLASSAWYVKGLASAALGLTENALKAWETGLSLDSQDEIMRSAFELLIHAKVAIEDSRRSKWAQYHIDKAQVYNEKYLSQSALYEFQRALRLDPLNTDARLALADILLRDGYSESFLSQLTFIRDQAKASNKVNDLIESYTSMLHNTLPLQWGIDPFYLDKNRWSMKLFYFKEKLSLYHQGALSVTAEMLSDIFSSSESLTIQADIDPVTTYAQAFRSAREQGFDFFGLIGFTEGERSLTVHFELYSAKTGNKAASWNVYRTGNDRFSSALQKLRKDIQTAMPQKGKIIARRGNNLLIDFGRKDGAIKEQVFTIYRKGDIQLSDSTLGLKYDENKALGTINISSVGEDISQGIFTQKGFYDLVNIGDEVLFQPAAVKTDSVKTPAAKTPAAKPDGAKTPATKPASVPSEVPAVQKQTSVLYELIQSIR